MEIAYPDAAAAGPKQQREELEEGPKLTAIEAQRATAVLQGMVKKLALLGTLASRPTLATPSSSSLSSPRSPRVHYDELTRFVREEVGRHLEEQRRLEAKHAELSLQWERLIRQQQEEDRAADAAHAWGGDDHDHDNDNDKDGGSTSSGDDPRVQQQEMARLQAELQATGEALSQNAQYICRQLKENPRVSGFALKVEQERAGLLRLLEAVAGELQARAGGFAGTLCSKMEAEAFAQEHLGRVLEEEREASEAVLCIESDLRTGAGQHKGRVRELQEAIAQLRTQLDAVQYKSEVEAKYARREGKARVGAMQRVFVQEERDLARKLARLKAQNAMEREAHADLAAYLRGKHEETAAQVAAWREASARELGELDAALTRLTEERAVALEELAALRERRREEQVLEAAEKEAERLRQVEERKAELLARARRRAKTKVEAAIAVYAMARRAKKEQEEAAAAPKKKGRGKGGGKEGKKKEGGGAKEKKGAKEEKGKAPAAAAAAKKPAAAATKKK